MQGQQGSTSELICEPCITNEIGHKVRRRYDVEQEPRRCVDDSSLIYASV